MLGWFKSVARRASFKNIWRAEERTSSSAKCLRRLMTMSLLTPATELRDKARKTSPMPPAPRFARRRNLPKIRLLPDGEDDNVTTGFSSWSRLVFIDNAPPSTENDEASDATSPRCQYMLAGGHRAVERGGRDRCDNVAAPSWLCGACPPLSSSHHGT